MKKALYTIIVALSLLTATPALAYGPTYQEPHTVVINPSHNRHGEYKAQTSLQDRWQGQGRK